MEAKGGENHRKQTQPKGQHGQSAAGTKKGAGQAGDKTQHKYNSQKPSGGKQEDAKSKAQPEKKRYNNLEFP
jgi:hypothetical protein